MKSSSLKWSIALRYLRSEKSHSVVNLISVVVVVAVAVTVAASVFVIALQGGLTEHVKSMYHNFDSDLRVTSAAGGFFELSEPMQDKLEELKADGRIVNYATTIEGDVLLENKNSMQVGARARGVDENFAQTVSIDSSIVRGGFDIGRGDISKLVLGQALAYNLGVNPTLRGSSLTLYGLGAKSAHTPLALGGLLGAATSVRSERSRLSGTFSVDQALDSHYLFTSKRLLRSLLGVGEGAISSVEISLDEHADVQELIDELGVVENAEKLLIQSREQQRVELNRVLNIERYLIFALLVMISAIATLSLCGALVMMVSEKRSQSHTLLHIGYTSSDVRGIFTRLGVLIGGSGMLLGIALGVALVMVQQTTGILQFAGEGMELEYPTELAVSDLSLIALTSLGVVALISTLTTRSLKF